MSERTNRASELALLLLLASFIQPASAAVFQAGDAAELVAAISGANATPAIDVIELTGDIVLTSVDNIGNGSNGLPTVVTPIVLLGNGHSISRDAAAPQFRFFEVLGGFFGDGELVLDGVVLAGGDVSAVAPPASPCFVNIEVCGGAALVLTGGLTLRNGVTLENNAAYGGGGMFIAGSEVLVTDSTFSGNRAEIGGAIATQVSSAGRLAIERSTFTGNEAGTSGGAIYNRSNMEIADSTFDGNRLSSPSQAFHGGGAVYNANFSGQADIATSLFTNNEASNGGALMNFNAADMIIRNSDIVANRLAGFGSGGGINNGGSGAAVTISDSRINDNDVAAAFGDGGGIFSSQGRLTLENSEVMGNTAGGDGGGVAVTEGRIANSRIENNRTTVGAGGGVYHSGLNGLEIVASSLSNNVARRDGGGLATFIGNAFPPDGITISDSRISGNTSEQGSGGGIANTEQGRVTIIRSQITDNIAAATIFAFGGGVFSNNTFTETTIIDSTIANNTANSGGGGVYNNNASVMTINHSTITNNLSNSQTGGIATLSTMRVSDSIIANNVGAPDSPNCLALFGLFDDGGNFTNDIGLNFPCPATFTETASLNLGALADNGGPTKTQALLAGSAAIDGGVNCTTATDQRGVLRQPACDAGAYEGDVAVPLFRFELATSDVDESPGGAHEVFVELDNTAGDIADAAVEVFVTIDGLAASGRDYDVTLGPPIIFGNGNWPAPGTTARQAVEFDILPDYLLEGDETITLGLRDGGFSGPASLSGTDEHTVTIADALADLEVDKGVDATGTVAPGGSITYQITVSNLGPSDAADVSLYDVLDGTALNLATANVTTSIGVFNPATGDWSLDGTLQGNGFVLAAGAMEILTVTAEVLGGAADTVTNTAELSRFFPPLAADPDPGNDWSTVSFDVCDTTPPTLSIELSPDRLWPPNHKLRNISATVSASDETGTDPTVTLLSVTSNEPDNGLGDGDTANDIVIRDDVTFRLRAERSGLGDGRVYTITYEATDVCGNTTIESAEVTVPKSEDG